MVLLLQTWATIDIKVPMMGLAVYLMGTPVTLMAFEARGQKAEMTSLSVSDVRYIHTIQQVWDQTHCPLSNEPVWLGEVGGLPGCKSKWA